MAYAPVSAGRQVGMGKISLKGALRSVGRVVRPLTAIAARSGIPLISTAGAVASRLAQRRSPRQAVMEAAAAGEIDPGIAQVVSDRAAAVSRSAAAVGATSAGSLQLQRAGSAINPTLLIAGGVGVLALLFVMRGKK